MTYKDLVSISWRLCICTQFMSTNSWHESSSPSMKLSLSRWGGLIHQEVSAKLRQQVDLNWVSQLKPSGQQIFSTIISSPESILIRQDYIRLYLPLCCDRTSPEVSEEEGSYTSLFYRWFLESFKNCLLLLLALPVLIDTRAQLLAWRSLLWLSMM